MFCILTRHIGHNLFVNNFEQLQHKQQCMHGIIMVLMVLVEHITHAINVGQASTSS